MIYASGKHSSRYDVSYHGNCSISKINSGDSRCLVVVTTHQQTDYRQHTPPSTSTSLSFPNMSKTLKVAAIQAEPVWQDLQGGVEKSIRLIQDAASNGANVIGFPEVFIPGYPWYVICVEAWADQLIHF